MTVNDIRAMSDERLVEEIDELVKRGNVKGEIDDDTVLWQQLRIELSTRLAELRHSASPFTRAGGAG